MSALPCLFTQKFGTGMTKHLNPYFMVYLKVEKDILITRDQKGLYSNAQNGEESNVVGMNMTFNEPIEAHLTLVNNLPDQMEWNLREILRYVEAM